MSIRIGHGAVLCLVDLVFGLIPGWSGTGTLPAINWHLMFVAKTRAVNRYSRWAGGRVDLALAVGVMDAGSSEAIHKSLHFLICINNLVFHVKPLHVIADPTRS